MPDFADDTKTELERKADQLKWVALVETLSYFVLFTFWVPLDNVIGTKIMGFFHGWITVAYWVMVVWIWPSMRWRWYWLVIAVVPVVGSVAVAEKIRRDGVPLDRRRFPAAA